MYIITLNEENVVTHVEQVGPGFAGRRMTGNNVLMLAPPQLDQLYDEMTNTFTPIVALRKRWLTKLAFDNRFTMTEAVALKLAQTMPAKGGNESDADYTIRCQTAAQLQVLQQRLNMASYIDLDRMDTRAGVQALESLGLLAEGRAEEILDGVIEEDEYHPGA